MTHLFLGLEGGGFKRHSAHPGRIELRKDLVKVAGSSKTVAHPANVTYGGQWCFRDWDLRFHEHNLEAFRSFNGDKGNRSSCLSRSFTLTCCGTRAYLRRSYCPRACPSYHVYLSEHPSTSYRYTLPSTNLLSWSRLLNLLGLWALSIFGCRGSDNWM